MLTLNMFLLAGNIDRWLFINLFQRPTAIAKILGVYRIGFRNQQTNHAAKQDLLVMENLFYNRNISQVRYHSQGGEGGAGDNT